MRISDWSSDVCSSDLWRSRTRDAASGEPRYAESGFLRSTPDGVELVVAHSFGIVETATGTALDGVLDLHSHGLQGTPSAKRVDHVDRRYALSGDELRYDIAMAAVRVPLTHRSEEHTSELQSLMRISYAVFCLKKKKINLKQSQEIYY